MVILGIGGILSDAACALLKDGRLAAAVEQKKVARRVRAGELPEESIRACLQLAGTSAEKVDIVALTRPFAHGGETAPQLQLRTMFPNAQVLLVEHHAAHAASAFYLSPFEDAVVLTLDRLGDFRCGARWQGRGNELRLDKEIYYPDSLGDLYGRVTALLGFEPNADEHKVQWLSTFGDGRYTEVFQEILGSDGADWPRLDRSFMDPHHPGPGGFSAKFYERLQLPSTEPIPEMLHPAIAAGIQQATEEAVARMAGQGENLCLAGGVALNALLIAALENSGQWKNVFVQPASGNAGTALGAVCHAWHRALGEHRRANLDNLCLGPGYDPDQIKQVLENCKLRLRYLPTTDDLIDKAVAELNESRIIAWMHGRMEFGPRALGNRSILASPLNPYSTENLNAYIKHREPFRKFAASVPAEIASEYFEVGPNARYLATVGRVRSAHKKTFESAVLGQDRVRVHTVSERDNPLYWRLLHAAGKSNGLPVLYNTSFNLFGDPLVCSPRDAVRSFYSSGIDAMFVGHFFLEK